MPLPGRNRQAPCRTRLQTPWRERHTCVVPDVQLVNQVPERLQLGVQGLPWEQLLDGTVGRLPHDSFQYLSR